MKTRLPALLWALLLPASGLLLQGCPSKNDSPSAPAPVTVVELVTATFTPTPTASPTNTPGGPATATPVPPPAVINGYFTTDENTALVLSNSTLNSLVVSSTSGDPLIFIFPGSPNHGTVSLVHSGFTNSVTYTPNSGFYGTDSFAYYVHDQNTFEDSSVQTMVITVAFVATATPTSTATATPTATPAPPVVTNGTFTTTENTGLFVSSSAASSLIVLDPNNDPLTFSLVGSPAQGVAIFNPDGSFTYGPNAGYTGTDSFTFKVIDSTTSLSSNIATVMINVNP
jgi:hypothetical protein